MKKLLLSIFALMLSAAHVFSAASQAEEKTPAADKPNSGAKSPAQTTAQNAAEEKVGDVVTLGSNAFMLVRVFDTPEKNDIFQRNVNIMRQYAQVIAESKQKLEKLADGEERTALQNKIKQMEDEFEANEKAMVKVYAFASNRQYRQVFLKTSICIPLSAEELSNLRSAEGMELDPLKIIERQGKNFYIMKNVDGQKDNADLQKAIGFTLSRRAETDKLRVKLSETTDPAEQMALTEKISLAEKALKQNEEDLKTRYGLGNAKSYIVEVDLSKLYLVLTAEELAKLKAERKK